MSKLGIKAGIIVGAFAAGAIGFALAGGASAAPASTPLNPAPGAASYGTGTVTVDSAGTQLFVRVDAGGLRAGTAYRVSACTNLGSQLSCASNPATDVAVSDAIGGIHASFATPAPGRTDVVTLTDVADATDSYQAWFTAPTYVTAPSFPVYPTFVGARVLPNGVVVVPAGTGVYPSQVCPPGFVGRLTVFVGGYTNNGVYTFGTVYPWAYSGVPYGAYAVTVNCVGI